MATNKRLLNRFADTLTGGSVLTDDGFLVWLDIYALEFQLIQFRYLILGSRREHNPHKSKNDPLLKGRFSKTINLIWRHIPREYTPGRILQLQTKTFKDFKHFQKFRSLSIPRSFLQCFCSSIIILQSHFNIVEGKQIAWVF